MPQNEHKKVLKELTEAYDAVYSEGLPSIPGHHSNRPPGATDTQWAAASKSDPKESFRRAFNNWLLDMHEYMGTGPWTGPQPKLPTPEEYGLSEVEAEQVKNEVMPPPPSIDASKVQREAYDAVYSEGLPGQSSGALQTPPEEPGATGEEVRFGLAKARAGAHHPQGGRWDFHKAYASDYRSWYWDAHTDRMYTTGDPGPPPDPAEYGLSEAEAKQIQKEAEDKVWNR
jgi:hypothetical protein